jgi:hypothetical protein
VTSTEARQVVDAYHLAWTTKHFDEAVALLAPALEVEVPINTYPTTESFAAALVQFGKGVIAVEVLSKFADGDEAMILYDMDVAGVGAIRVAEHFTVADAQIVRIRQVHDTAALRAAGFDRTESEDGPRRGSEARPADGYANQLHVAAPLGRLFDALTSLDGLVGWWASAATGSGSSGMTFELSFAGLDETITMHVDIAEAPSIVQWTCLTHTGLPDWEGTTIIFELGENPDGSTQLAFRHVGLVPNLDCYEQCRAGWDHFLPSFRSYVEQGKGTPFRRTSSSSRDTKSSRTGEVFDVL